jgi:hypothetical protein
VVAAGDTRSEAEELTLEAMAEHIALLRQAGTRTALPFLIPLRPRVQPYPLWPCHSLSSWRAESAGVTWAGTLGSSVAK